jgi:hypothetical protein
MCLVQLPYLAEWFDFDTRRTMEPDPWVPPHTPTRQWQLDAVIHVPTSGPSQHYFEANLFLEDHNPASLTRFAQQNYVTISTGNSQRAVPEFGTEVVIFGLTPPMS